MLSLRGLGFSACSVLFLTLGACTGDGTGPAPLPTVECTDASVVDLAVGEHVILDPAERGSCVRVPAAGSAGAQYLYAALSTAGAESQNGTSASYQIVGGTAGGALADVRSTSVPTPPNPTLSAFRPRRSATAFHRMLRERERALAASPAAALFRSRRGAQTATAAAVVPPTVGDERTFFVCGTPECNNDDFVEVAAVATHVGERVAIYVDEDAPTPLQGGYSTADLNRVVSLFDEHLYPIDTTAFGREPDIDNNGVVIVLLTPRVNALSESCADGVILGYFFGEDLVPSPETPKSNAGEIFYGLVPDPTGTYCTFSNAGANASLPPTFVHEFQHMISFNQHYVERSAPQEDVWLNEGLSHFAEEIAGRVLSTETDESQCANNDCLSQFAAANLANLYRYLLDAEEHYLVAPGSSGASLEERGAGWSFVRWLVDHYGSDEFGRNVTRALVNTGRLGAANVEAVVDEPFRRLVPRWQLANYLDNLPAFNGDDVLQYPSWNLRVAFAGFHEDQPDDFPNEYPLVPEAVTAGGYNRSGVLRAGSGRHLLITQPASGASIDVQLTASDGESLPAANARVMIAVARIR